MKKKIIAFLLIFVLFLTSCSIDNDLSNEEEINDSVQVLQITKHPRKATFNRGKLNELPSYNSDSSNGWQVDLRSYDLSSLDITDRYDDLIYADFDSQTIWPQQIPLNFNPQLIMELGKNPGLGIRELHSNNIDGRGVGIAIIDQNLLVDHVEYKDNLKLYEEFNWKSNNASMHGCAVASIAVGKSVGVAPKSNLYFIANWFVEDDGTYNYEYIAKSIDRILEINESLPQHKKIRVISISKGWDSDENGYNEVMEAISTAKEQGIFVVSSSLVITDGFVFQGLGRDIIDNPDNANFYKPGLWWEDAYYNGEYFSSMEQAFDMKIDEILLVPMDSRCTASPTGEDDYAFYRTGGWSRSIPYITGVYALACQVEPDITPEIFWSKALETGDTTTIKNGNKEYKFGKIINPISLIESLNK